MKINWSGYTGKKWPFALQLKMLFGYPFGLRRIGGRELAVVYRMGRFHSLRGPHEFRLWLLVEVVRYLVDLAHQHLSDTLEGLATKDGARVQALVELQFNFDPRPLPRHKIMTAVRRVKQTGAEAIVRDNAQAAMNLVCGRYSSEQIARNEVTLAVELEFLNILAKRLANYGLNLQRDDCYVRTFVPSERLGTSLDEAAGRAVEVESTGQFADGEIRRALAIKVAESLQHMKNGMPFINTPQLIDLRQPDHQITPHPAVVHGQFSAPPQATVVADVDNTARQRPLVNDLSRSDVDADSRL